ncbi:hypothetical protein ACLMJK_009402 [Lecanora helva]
MSEPRVWVLLAGINFYPDEALRLKGAVNDVVDIERNLKTYFKIINVTKLLAPVIEGSEQRTPSEDEHLWPTWDNFTGAIKRITDEASEGDVVWIYYAGHGTLHSTDTKEFIYHEGYGTDAALVLLEPSGQRGIRYLRGIELAWLLDAMVSKKLRPTVVLDSCHSGSISRNEDSIVRGIPWSVDVDSEFPLDVPPLPQLSVRGKTLRNTETASHWLLYPHGYTLLAACGPHDVAREIKTGYSQQVHGAFSFLVCKAFKYVAQEGIKDVTHETNYRHVSANMSGRLKRQYPILAGKTDTTLWGADVGHLDIPSTFEIIQGSAYQEIWINGGLVHGVCTGDEYGVYTHAEAKESIARITITNVEAVRSIAQHTSATDSKSDSNSSQIKNGYRAILLKLARPRAYVKLDSGVVDLHIAMFKESVWLHYLPPEEKVPVDIPSFSVVKADSQRYTILHSNGDHIPNIPPLLTANHSVGEQVLTVLEHLSRYTFVQNLDNRRTNSLTDSDFTITVKPQADHLSLDDSGSSITVPHGSKVRIEFLNLTEEVLYFAVMSLAQFGQIKHISPGHTEYESVLPRDLKKVAPHISNISPPGAVRFPLKMTVPARLTEKQQDFVATEDLLKFIVSTEPINGTKNLKLPDLWDAVENRNATLRSADRTFGKGVQESLVEHSRGRGYSAGEKPIIRWACQTKTIRTVLERSSESAA